MARNVQPINSALILGQYQLLDRIAQGGMGELFKARHLQMQRDVAVKIIAEQWVGSPEAVQRFEQEVRAASQLSHPNIAAAYDAGEQSGVHYLVLEYVDGLDLATVVSRQGALTIPTALDYLRQAAEGLKYAHGKGIVHRDIKPANLMVDSSGVVKILDLGVAYSTSVDMRLTQSGQRMGTSEFMAPEQAVDARRADARSDLYSLGCTFFNLIVGHPPYRGATDIAVAIAHREEPIPSLRQERPEVPASVDQIYHKMVAKRPEHRFASMDELLIALRALNVPGEVTPSPSVTGIDQMPRLAADTAPGLALNFDTVVATRKKTNRPVRNSKQLALIVLAFFVMVGAAAGIMLSLETPPGALIIESADPKVKVEFQPQTAATASSKVAPPAVSSPVIPETKSIPTPASSLLPTLSSPADSTVKRVPVLKDEHELIGLREEPSAVAFSPDGEEVTACGRSGHAVLWNTATGSVVRQVRLPFAGENVAYSPDGKLIAFIGDRLGAVIVDRETGKLIHTLSHISAEEEQKLLVQTDIYPTMLCLAFSPDGKRLVAGTNLNEVVVWEVAGGVELARFKVHASAINGIAFSPNGRQFVSASHDGTLQIWNAETYERLNRLRHDRETCVFDVLFSPDSAFIYSVGNAGNVVQWDADTGVESGVLIGKSGPTLSISLSADAKFLVTASVDGPTVTFWDPTTKQMRSMLRNGSFQPSRVRCSPTDPTLIAFVTTDQSSVRLVRYVGDKMGD
ncbi:MAG: serine/threonine-protein kinase [Pirellulales bacterium]